MGFFIRLLLSVFGVETKSRHYLSEVSKSIDLLKYCNTKKNTRWFWGGCMHAVPVFLTLGLLFLLRAKQVTHGMPEIAALIIAMTWSFAGPALIWYYEHYTVPRFCLQCRSIFLDKREFALLRTLAHTSMGQSRIAKLLTFVWIAVVLWEFYVSREFVFGFGIAGLGDFFYWVFLLGTGLIAYYGCIGIFFAHRAYRLTQIVSKAKLRHEIFHADQVLGLSFIGDFALRTSVMFASGWLFAPLVIFIWRTDYAVPLVLVGSYFCWTVAAFMAPIYSVHKKIVEEKSLITRPYTEAANFLASKLAHNWTDTEGKQFAHIKDVLREIRSISNWPSKFDVLVKFSISSIVTPIAATVLSIMAKTIAGH